MRRRIVGVLAGVLTLIAPAGAAAMLMAVEVNIGMQLGFETLQTATITGKATVNASAGGIHLVTLNLHPMDPVPLCAIDPCTTDCCRIEFVHPNITPQIASLRLMNAEIKGGTLFMTPNTMPLAGTAKVCLFGGGCGSFLDIPFTENGTRGIGLGGNVTKSTVSGSLVFQLVNAPWQIASAMLLQQTTTIPPTPSSGLTIYTTHTGYAQGPASATSSTALTGGVIQLVSPTQLHNTGILGGNHNTIALFTTLTVTLLPEPELLLLLGSGVAGLVLIGRSRIRQ